MTTTLDQRLYMGDRAREVIENEAFIAAFEAIEKEVTEQWMNSPARDEAGREKCWTYLMLLRMRLIHLHNSFQLIWFYRLPQQA